MAAIITDLYISLANGRMLPGIPPREESGDSYFYSDVCYENPTTYCNELMPGHREVVASWYLTPERLAKETVWVTLTYFLLLVFIVPRLLCPISVKCGHKNLRPHFLISVASVTCLSLQTYYKVWDASAYPNKVFFLVMPCNVTWIINVLLGFAPLSNVVRHSMIQFLLSFQVLVWAVFAAADTADLKGPYEVEFFWFNHVLLLIPPFYYVLSGKVSTFKGLEDDAIREVVNFLQWIIFACAIMGVFYFAVVTPLSFYSLLNLNYMLSPPPGTGLEGEDYRLISQGIIAVGFTIGRLVMVFVEFVLVGKKKKAD
ncbi:hypothetical protein TL16_g05109 [Triparma laevis f. inornata]|uniref:Uncharacterized protein n=2 Tax=Triparma laevis TaxID=1534972 RepID=A0A9W6ZY01_9STRA|nr:hypothetical protein TrLO_g2965 [Triparma laevis f. longispina]GMH69231.1 hypothetical protein TL16_g05109 [Triparma laevis f. inornata]